MVRYKETTVIHNEYAPFLEKVEVRVAENAEVNIEEGDRASRG